MKKILIVDDDAEVRDVMTMGLSTDFNTIAVASGEEALERLRDDKEIGVILVDIDRPRADDPRELEKAGLGLLATVKFKYPDIKRIAMSGREHTELTGSSLVHDFWAKPFLLREVIISLEHLMNVVTA